MILALKILRCNNADSNDYMDAVIDVENAYEADVGYVCELSVDVLVY